MTCDKTTKALHAYKITLRSAFSLLLYVENYLYP